MNSQHAIHGAGLGLRREFIDSLLDSAPSTIDFIEVAPENWMNMGGKFAKQLQQATEQYPLLCHGLSLSIGSPAPLDEDFVKSLKKFFDQYNVHIYSEHLSYCSDDGHLYDLLPIPFTEEAVHYVAQRIKRVQDILERRIAIENVSYYASPGQEILEIDFLTAILEEADCDLLLDLNNIYVNSINQKYDAKEFLLKLPHERIAYAHIAGHYDEADDLKIDTHGADVIDPVWQLLDLAYEKFGVFPTLLERDFNIPPINILTNEVDTIHQYQNKWQSYAQGQRLPG